MSLFSKLYGTVASFFQIGGPSGPGIYNSSGVLQARNAANNAYVTMSGATPTTDNNFATKQYVDTTANKPIPVSLQFNGNNTLPVDSSTEQWYIVTTSGANATIGEILWDDGLNTGATVTVLPAVTGNTVITTTAFVGGTVTFGANQLLIWTGTAWADVIPSISGAIYELVTMITNAASQSSATTIPANAYVTNVVLNVTTPYSAGATIAVGQTGSTSLLLGTGDNTPQVADEYQSTLAVSWGSTAYPVLVTITGSPAAGAGYVVVEYCVPNA
jgi:hypothetical protein